MAVCQKSNGHQSARTAGGPYTNERIKRKKQVATTEQEVYVVKERMFLHKTVVQRAEPYEKTSASNANHVDDAHDQITDFSLKDQ